MLASTDHRDGGGSGVDVHLLGANVHCRAYVNKAFLHVENAGIRRFRIAELLE